MAKSTKLKGKIECKRELGDKRPSKPGGNWHHFEESTAGRKTFKLIKMNEFIWQKYAWILANGQMHIGEGKAKNDDEKKMGNEKGAAKFENHCRKSKSISATDDEAQTREEEFNLSAP